MEDRLSVNGKPYQIVRLLGKGKGGYSYLVTDGEQNYVLKQIHHEPCDYYSFGNKLEAELRDYETLSRLGIPMPRLLDVDHAQERLLKEYVSIQQFQEDYPEKEEREKFVCRLKNYEIDELVDLCDIAQGKIWYDSQKKPEKVFLRYRIKLILLKFY